MAVTTEDKLSGRASIFRSLSQAVVPDSKDRNKDGGINVHWTDQVLFFIAVVAFFGVSGVAKDQKMGQSTIINTLALGSVLAVVLPAAMLRIRELSPLLVRSPMLIGFLILAWLSIFWSESPGLTLRRDGSLIVPILAALILAYRYDTEVVIRLLSRFFLTLAILSVIVAVFIPSFGVMHVRDSPELTGAWRGITAHKNTFGYILTLGFQVFVWRALFEPKRKLLNVCIAVFFVLVCFKARASTSIVAITASVLLAVVFASWRTRGKARFFPEALLWLFVGGTVLFLPLMLDVVTQFLGKDDTLTGRIPLWEALTTFAAERPMLGHGYGAFWVAESQQMVRLNQIIHWAPPDAHNAYLEMLLELGLPGTFFATALLLSVIVRAYRLARSGGPIWASYMAMFAIVFALTNMVETLLLRMGDIFCFILVLCHFSLVKYSLSRHPTPAPMNRGFLRSHEPRAPEPSAPEPRSPMIPSAPRSLETGAASAQRVLRFRQIGGT